MTRSLQLDRRAFLKGIGGVALALAGSRRHGRGSDRPDSPPLLRDLHRQRHVAARRPSTASTSGAGSRRPSSNGEFVFGKSTEPLAPFRKQLSFLGGLYHPNGPKADPHVCSDMWLTGAPLHNPKPGTYNSVGLDQVIALHTKQYCRQPSLVLSIDAGTGLSLAHRHDLLQPGGQADPGGKQPAPRLRPPVPRRPHVAESRAREAAAAHQAGGRRGRERALARPASSARPTASGWIST